MKLARYFFIPLIALAAVAMAADYKVIVDGMTGPENLAFTGEGALYISDTNHLWKVDNNGSKEEIYARDPDTDGMSLGGVSLGPQGKIYFSVGNAINIYDPASGDISTLTSGFSFANGNCFDDAGNLYVADAGAGTLYVVPAGTDEAKVMKDDMGWLKSLGVNGLVWNRDNNTLYYTVTMPGRVGALKLGPGPSVVEENVIKKFAIGGLDDLTLDADGNLFVCVWMKGKVMKMTPSGETEVIIEGLDGPSAVAFGPGADSDDLFILIKGGTLKFKGTKMIATKTDTTGCRLPFMP